MTATKNIQYPIHNLQTPGSNKQFQCQTSLSAEWMFSIGNGDNRPTGTALGAAAVAPTGSPRRGRWPIRTTRRGEDDGKPADRSRRKPPDRIQGIRPGVDGLRTTSETHRVPMEEEEANRQGREPCCFIRNQKPPQGGGFEEIRCKPLWAATQNGMSSSMSEKLGAGRCAAC